MNAFNSQFWKQFLAIAKPYWYPGKEGGRKLSAVLWSWSMLALLLLLLLSINAINAYNSYVARDLIDFLEQKDTSNFFRVLGTYAVMLLTLTPLVGSVQYLRGRVALDWYEFLTTYILDKYFSHRAYYKINFQDEIENPDQRIAQEIEPIPKVALSIVFIFIEKILEMITFISIIWAISKWVAVIVIIYALLGNTIASHLSQEVSKITSDQLSDEADYSYCLTHVRDNAESIAFFQGEAQESRLIKRRFANVIRNIERMNQWRRNQQIFTTGYQSFLNLLPFVAIAPLYFIDKIELGEVNQASTACNIFAGALAVMVMEFGSSGRFVNFVDRLATFSEALEAASKEQEPATTIETVEENRLALEHLTLQTPNYERVIVQDLSAEIEPGAGLLIVGPSGRGKSSLLRAIAGLWDSGTGRIIRPKLEEILFLPQRPYMILGTLREQLLYPNRNRQITDLELEQVLEQVNLQHLLARVGGFDAEVYWESILSLGEQQRLAFARLLVTRPRYIILDEATSALDLSNEANLYQQLQRTGTTFISVGHRESLFNYHQWVLELSGDSNWRLVSTREYRANAAQENQIDTETASPPANLSQVTESEASIDSVVSDETPQTSRQLFPELSQAIEQAKNILKSKKSSRISLANLLSRLYSSPVAL